MKQILLVLVLLSAITASGKNVPADQAARTAKNFYLTQLWRSGQTDYTGLTIIAILPGSQSDRIVYYQIRMNDDGWVIVSADDAVTPILAYGFEGGDSMDEQPPQYRAWMEGYARQIAWVQEQHLTASATDKASWEQFSTFDPESLPAVSDGRDVAPMLTSNWNQGNPYNFLCPADAAGSGGHVYAGCVATAMAQVLYYYSWPETGWGEHCYTPSGYAQQCADFANTTYAWNEMVNSTGSRDTAMGLIQWHCGIAVDMMYGAGGSGAYSEDAAEALRTYFKCHPNTQLEYKENYSEADWAALLRENIDAKRPLYYHGFGSGGHAFNVDGYQGTDYFHFNWGWGGSNNGYYYLNNLNPGGSNFTEGQGAIVNIYPDTLTYTYPAYCTGEQTLTALKGTFEDGSCPLNYQNNANCTWLIAPESNADSVISITISFQRFATEAGVDQVTIYKGSNEQGEIIGQFSGDNIPAAVTVDGNEALVSFTTDGANTQPGWFASYTCASMDWCQGMTVLTDPEGSISDGSFDFHYKNSTMCRWKIVPEGTGAIELQFTSFHTASENDVLRIYDLETEILLASYSGTYTGGDVPPPVSAPGGQLFLIFTTDATETAAGWEADYFTYPVGVDTRLQESRITLFPNPTSDRLNIRIQDLEGNMTATLSDITGHTIMQDSWMHQKADHQMDIRDLASGIYLLQIVTTEGTSIHKVIIN